MMIKRWLRRLLWIGIGLVFLLVVAILVLPSVVSGTWGRERLEGILSDRLGTRVRLGAVDFGWTSGLVVDGLTIGEDPETGLRVRRLTARPELFSLLSDEIRIHRIEIEGVDLVVVRERDGRVRVVGWPEPRPAAPPTEPGEPTEIPRISGVIALRDANVTFRDEATGANGRIEDVAVDVSFEPGAASLPVSLALAGLEFSGEVDLFENDRIREEPGVGGVIEFDGFRLETYAGLLPFVDGLDRLAGRVSGSVKFDVPRPTETSATLDLALDGLDAAGSALEDPLVLSGSLRLAGNLALDDAGVSAKNVDVAHEGTTLSIPSGSFRDGNAVRAVVEATTSAASVRAKAPGLIPEGAEGSATVGATITGTLDALTAEFEIQAADLAMPDVPEDLGRLPIAATGRATWSKAGDRIEVEGTATRGALAIEVRGAVGEGDDPTARVRIHGTLTEDDLLPWVCAEQLSSLGSGPVTVDGHVNLSGGDDPWTSEIHVARGARTLFASGVMTTRPASWSAEGEVRLADSSGAPLLEDVPELGSSWNVDGNVDGLGLGSDLLVGELRIRLGQTRNATVNFDLRDLLTDRRRGTVRAEWSSPLRHERPDLASRLILDGRGQGRVEARLEGGGITVVSETNTTGLVVVVPGGLEIREPNLDLSAKVDLAPDGRLDLTAATVKTPRLGADFEGRLSDVLGRPTGSGRIQARGDLAGLRAYLEALGPDAPEGFFETDLTTEITEDALEVIGSVRARTLVVGEHFKADDATVALDATLLREAPSIVLRKFDLQADETTRAAVTGRLDLGSDRPRFVGRVTASGNLAWIPTSLLPAETTLRGDTSLEAVLADDGAFSVEARATDLRVEGPDPVIEESELTLAGRGTWSPGGDGPVVEGGHLEAPWGKLDLRGRVAFGAPGKATLDIDVDLPAFLKTHPALFPEKSKARGRATGKITYSGRIESPRDGTAEGRLAIERLTLPGYDVKDGDLDLRFADGILEVREAGGRVNGGATRVTGTVDLNEDEPVFAGRFSTENLRLAPTMEPIARYASPLFALASDLSGLATLSGEFETRGLDQKALIAALGADVTLRVDEGQVTGSPMLRSLLSLLQRGDKAPALRFDDLDAVIQIQDGKLVTEDLRILSKDIDIRFRGMTGLVDRSIRYAVRVKLPGQEKNLPPLLRALDPEGYIPLRLGGSLTAPSLLPPDPKDLGSSLIEGLLKDLLRGKDKKKDKDRK